MNNNNYYNNNNNINNINNCINHNNIYDNCVCNDGIYCYKCYGVNVLTIDELCIIYKSQIFDDIVDRLYFIISLTDNIDDNIDR